MENVAVTIEGARWPHLIMRWLESRDAGWNAVAGMRRELRLRRIEDVREGRALDRFDLD